MSQRLGGYAALIAATTFVFGFALFATALADYTTGDPTPAESVAFLVEHQTTFYVWNLVILIVFGVAVVPLVLALAERLRADAPALAQVSVAFGVIWAALVIAAGMIANLGLGALADAQEADPGAAASTWSALDVVQNGLGGGNELVGSLWLLAVCAGGLRTELLPRGACNLGLIVGAAGVLTVVPALEAAGAIFGLGLIVWFVWVGITLVREPATARAAAEPRRYARA